MGKTAYLKIFALVAITLFFSLQKGNGYLLVVALPFFLATTAYHLLRMFQRPAERQSRGIRLAVWSITFALAGGVQAYWSAASRTAAESASEKILAYKDRAGTYPASLKEAGLDDRDLKDKWKIRYALREGKPALSYPAPITPLAVCEYDFETREWRENAY